MSQIFVSYARADRDFVDRLIQDLERKGFDVWVDRKDISGGSDWRAAISQAIRECRAFLLVLSPNSADSKKVIQELSLADEHKRQIIPLMYQPCDIPPDMELQLASLQRVDFTEQSFEEALDQLEQALGSKSTVKPPQSPRAKKKRERDTQRSPESHTLASPTPPALPPVYAPATPAPPPVFQLLAGTWQVQIGHPLMGVANLTLEMAPNGLFRGQLLTPVGVTVVQGQWQITPLNQLVLQGQETSGFQVLPYMVMIQFNQIAPNQLVGVTSAGEQVVWQRIG